MSFDPFHTYAVATLNLTYTPIADSQLVLRLARFVLVSLQRKEENLTSPPLCIHVESV